MRLTKLMNKRIRVAMDTDATVVKYTTIIKNAEASKRAAIAVYRAEFHQRYRMMFEKVNRVNHFEKGIKVIIQEKRKAQDDYFKDTKKAFVKLMKRIRLLDIKIGKAHHAVGKRRTLVWYKESKFYRSCVMRGVEPLDSNPETSDTDNAGTVPDDKTETKL